MEINAHKMLGIWNLPDLFPVSSCASCVRGLARLPARRTAQRVFHLASQALRPFCSSADRAPIREARGGRVRPLANSACKFDKNHRLRRYPPSGCSIASEGSAGPDAVIYFEGAFCLLAVTSLTVLLHSSLYRSLQTFISEMICTTEIRLCDARRQTSP